MDFWLEMRVSDLVSTAKLQKSLGSYDAAADACRTALASVDEALSHDPADAAALRWRQELTELMPQFASAASAPVAPPATREITKSPETRLDPSARPVPAPSFQLLENDGPELTLHHDILGDRGGYLPEPEPISILDPTPIPEKRDYTRIAAVLMAAALGAVGTVSIVSFLRKPADLGPVPPQMRAAAPARPAEQSDFVDDTLYYPATGVSLPLLIRKVAPEYTDEARQAHYEGTVRLLVEIDETGKPRNVRVWRGLDDGLTKKAVECVLKWVFRPGMKNGRPVPVLAQIDIDFKSPQ